MRPSFHLLGLRLAQLLFSLACLATAAYAFFACLLSGLAEPIGAIIGYVLLRPYLSDAVFGAVFGVIAGVMVFLALDELLPAAKRYAKGHETVYGLVTGMGALAISLVLFKW